MDRAAELLADRPLAVLTGAGVSTDSGIPDYRGPDSPVRTPMTYQDFTRTSAGRQRYWARSFVGWRRMKTAEPNRSHRVIAAWEAQGRMAGLITQNVDGLHQQAGSEQVIDLHGRLDRVICLNCRELTGRVELERRLTLLNPHFDVSHEVELAPDGDALVADTSSFVMADCLNCGGVLKPDVVFFGESVPPERVSAAYEVIETAGALLVAGSSLTVYSGLRFVRRAAQEGRPIVIVNRGATRGDDLATVKIDAPLAEVLPALLARVH
ncbi:NAD-dependent protein deacetylase [Nakamurella silvestris]|nr:NAD-dependent protein deacetylase [Nakamurella silvestris]